MSFGNIAELLLALFVLMDGRPDVVKGQITGSIIGNSLLGLGLAVVVGSWGRHRQTFNRQSASRLSSLLILSVIALLLPALFDYTERGGPRAGSASLLDERLSLGVSVVLILVYAANLFYTLVTHRDIFGGGDEATNTDGGKANAGGVVRDNPSIGQDGRGKTDAISDVRGMPQVMSDGTLAINAASSDSGDGAAVVDPPTAASWPVWVAVAVLVVATAFTAWEAELVSGGLERAASDLGVSTFFLGVIALAIVGNAAEYVAAVYFARRDQMTMAITITVGSTIQVALLVAPLLVLVSHAMGRPMNLVFSNPLELIAIAAVAFTVNAIALDGETNWFEGVLLLAVYVLLALAFLLVTPLERTEVGGNVSAPSTRVASIRATSTRDQLRPRVTSQPATMEEPARMPTDGAHPAGMMRTVTQATA